MVLYGIAHRIGDSISSSDIIAPEWRDAGDPAVLAARCLAGVAPELAELVREGDLLLAGHSFGAGPGQEEAVLALQALGLAAVLCVSADPEMVASAGAYGLPILIAPEAASTIEAGELLRLDLARGLAERRADGRIFSFAPCAPALIEAVRRAQLLARTRRVVEEEGFDG